jgi:hypothetical protein
MKKTLTALALIAFLGGCTGGSLTPEQSDFLRQSAINRIAAFNAAGIQIVELTPVQLLVLDTACFTAITVATLRADDVGPEPMALPRNVERACTVIMKVAAGDAPVSSTIE